MHKIHIYQEYHSVCPLVRIGSAQPLSRKRVCLSPRNQREGGTLACEWEGGEPKSDDLWKSLALCLLYGVQYVHCIKYITSTPTTGCSRQYITTSDTV